MKNKNYLQLKTKNWYRYFVFTIKLVLLLILSLLILVILFKLFDYIINLQDKDKTAFPSKFVLCSFPFSLGNPYVYAANDKKDEKPSDKEGIFSRIWRGIRWILSPILEKKEKEKEKVSESKNQPNVEDVLKEENNPKESADFFAKQKEKEVNEKKNIFSKTWGWIKSWFIKSSTSSDSERVSDTFSEKVTEEQLTKSPSPSDSEPKSRSDELIAQYKKDDEIIKNREIDYFGKFWEIESKFKLELSTLVKDLKNIFSYYMLYNQLTRDEFLVIDQNYLVKEIEYFVEYCKKQNLSHEIIVNRIKFMISTMFINKSLNLENLKIYCRMFYRIQFPSKWYDVKQCVFPHENTFFQGYSLKGYQNYLDQVKNLNVAQVRHINFRFYNLISLYYDDLVYMSNKKAKTRLLARWSWFDKISVYSGSDLDIDEMSEYTFLKILDPEIEDWFKAKINRYHLNEEEINKCKRKILSNYQEGYCVRRSFSQDELIDSDKIAEYEKLFNFDIK